MKILVVSQYFYPERFSISDIAFELKKRGHSVSVITGKPNYGYGKIISSYKNVDNEIINGVKVHRVNLKARKESRISIINNYLSFYRNAKRYVRHLKEEYDVVLSCSLSPVISIAPACLYKKKHNVKHVLYCLDLWPESTVVTGAVKKNSLIYKILYRWSKKLYSKCDEIILSSESFKEYLDNELNLKEIETKYIPQPALLPNKSNEPIIFTNKHNVVYVGNIGKLQLIKEVVLASKNVPDELDFKLHIIGMGSDMNLLNDLIKNNHLENKVVYYGPKPVEEASRYYSNADALLVSLKNEGVVGKTIPNKLIQYLYFARPILGVISGDGKKVIENAKGGVSCEENIEKITEAYIKICSLSEEEKKTLGESNKNFFLNNFTLEKITYLIEEELQKHSKN